jgi:hypothetical protein
MIWAHVIWVFPDRINPAFETLTSSYILTAKRQTWFDYTSRRVSGKPRERELIPCTSLNEIALLFKYIRGCCTYCEALDHNQVPPACKLSFWSAMKFFNRFRKILTRLVFSGSTTSNMASKQRSCERFDPPRTSCSSYYSSHTHYSEAIADCIEFFNKSSQEGILDGRKSDVWVWYIIIFQDIKYLFMILFYFLFDNISLIYI